MPFRCRESDLTHTDMPQSARDPGELLARMERHLRRVQARRRGAGAIYDSSVPRLFHVTSELNRESILEHGLNWDFMGPACGIAGSRHPEGEGVFLCRDEGEAQWFIRMNNTGGPADVWAVDDVELADLRDNESGCHYLAARVPPSRVTLVARSLPVIGSASGNRGP
jgi:hypothetical protein